jgi:hypothetical protein
MSGYFCDQSIVQFKHPLQGCVSPFGWMLYGTMLSSSSLQECYTQHFNTTLWINLCREMVFGEILSLHVCYLYVYLLLLYSVLMALFCFTHKTVNTGFGHLFMKQVVSICWLWKHQSEFRCEEYSVSLSRQWYCKSCLTLLLMHALCWTICWYIL